MFRVHTIFEGQKLKDTVQDTDCHSQGKEVRVGFQKSGLQNTQTFQPSKVNHVEIAAIIRCVLRARIDPGAL